MVSPPRIEQQRLQIDYAGRVEHAGAAVVRGCRAAQGAALAVENAYLQEEIRAEYGFMETSARALR